MMSTKTATIDLRTPDGKVSGKSPSVSTARASDRNLRLDESMDVVLGPQLNPSGECTVLVQVDPEDAAHLDLEGSQGVIGRVETDGEGVILDLKGRLYRGRIFPGPTALLLSLTGKTGTPQLKVDAITDEFVRLDALGESIRKFEAKTMGDMDEYFVDEDDDVNRNSNRKNGNTGPDSQVAPHADHRPVKRRRAPAPSASAVVSKRRKPSKKR